MIVFGDVDSAGLDWVAASRAIWAAERGLSGFGALSALAPADSYTGNKWVFERQDGLGRHPDFLDLYAKASAVSSQINTLPNEPEFAAVRAHEGALWNVITSQLPEVARLYEWDVLFLGVPSSRSKARTAALNAAIEAVFNATAEMANNVGPELAAAIAANAKRKAAEADAILKASIAAGWVEDTKAKEAAAAGKTSEVVIAQKEAERATATAAAAVEQKKEAVAQLDLAKLIKDATRSGPSPTVLAIGGVAVLAVVGVLVAVVLKKKKSGAVAGYRKRRHLRRRR